MQKRTVTGNVVKGLLFSYLMTAGLLLVLALLLWKWNVSKNLIHAGMLVIYVFSPMIGGFYLGKRQKERKYLWGILIGSCYVISLILLSVLEHGVSGMIGKETAFAMIICILSGMLGGMVA